MYKTKYDLMFYIFYFSIPQAKRLLLIYFTLTWMSLYQIWSDPILADKVL